MHAASQVRAPPVLVDNNVFDSNVSFQAASKLLAILRYYQGRHDTEVFMPECFALRLNLGSPPGQLIQHSTDQRRLLLFRNLH